MCYAETAQSCNANTPVSPPHKQFTFKEQFTLNYLLPPKKGRTRKKTNHLKAENISIQRKTIYNMSNRSLISIKLLNSVERNSIQLLKTRI